MADGFSTIWQLQCAARRAAWTSSSPRIRHSPLLARNSTRPWRKRYSLKSSPEKIRRNVGYVTHRDNRLSAPSIWGRNGIFGSPKTIRSSPFRISSSRASSILICVSSGVPRLSEKQWPCDRFYVFRQGSGLCRPVQGSNFVLPALKDERWFVANAWSSFGRIRC